MKRYKRLNGGDTNGPGDPLTDLIGTRPWMPVPYNKPRKTIKEMQRDNTPIPMLVTNTLPGRYMPERIKSTVNPGLSVPDRSMPTTNTGKPGFFSRVFSQGNMKRLSKGAESITPFISNIVNSTRKAPKPNSPILDGFTSLKRIDLSDERNQVRRTIDAANKATERNVDSNTAEAIKAFNRGQEFDRLSSINERETNTNVNIGNTQSMMDAQVRGMNTERLNDFQTARTAAAIADQREQSANLANAGDKMVLMGNEKRKAKVQSEKIKVLSSLFSKSGVLSRQAREWKKMGVEDPLGMDYNYAENDDDYTKRTKDNKAYGGMLRGVPSMKIC